MLESNYSSTVLRTYLRQRRMGRAKDKIPEFEDFLRDVSVLFALRIAAEEYWSGSPRASDFSFYEHRYQANSLRFALPLEWDVVKQIILPDEDKPRSTLITYIATHCIEEVRNISSGLRRTLSRERVSTPIGKVQQLDTHCMRWLMRQPGRDFAEKGGVRQRVMSVVRREQYDTLENRVFKDFLIRAENLADSYLEELKTHFANHKVYLAVKRFRTVCQAALSNSEMDSISSLTTFTHPNYVLQQDNRYSKIWDAYGKIIRLSNLAEKLWSKRFALKKKLFNLRNESLWQEENKSIVRYHSQVWVNPLDGNLDFTEYTCSSHASADDSMLKKRESKKLVSHVERGIGIVDFSGDRVFASALCVGGFHNNARPRILDDSFPIFDDEQGVSSVVGLDSSSNAVKISLSSIFADLNNDSVQNEKGDCLDVATSHLNSYAARLFGEYRNIDRTLSELVILSPDDWNAVTQELVIRSFSMLSRKNVHLLWRSVAAAIGYEDQIRTYVKENDLIAVIDFRNNGEILVSGLKYLQDDETGCLVPQRSVYLRDGKVNESRYVSFSSTVSSYSHLISHSILKNSIAICIAGKMPIRFKHFLADSCSYKDVENCDGVILGRAHFGASRWVVLSDAEEYGWALKRGAMTFCKEHETRTLYYDEMEAMWVVGQYNENVVKYDIVKADDKFKGGTTREFALRDGLLAIGEGQRAVEFLFHIGKLTETTRLHSYKEILSDSGVKSTVALSGRVEVSPGQGIAITTIDAPRVLQEPIVLDYLRNMELSKWSIKILEEELPRSFPPTCAVVEPFSQYDYEGYSWSSVYAPTRTHGKIKSAIEGYIKGVVPLSQVPGDAFAKAQRKTINELRHDESKLHLLDRKNVFGNNDKNYRPYWLTEESESVLLNKLVKAISRDRDKCLRLLAWTYRGDNPELLKCLNEILDKYYARRNNTVGITPVEISFLSNFLSYKGLRKLEHKALSVLFSRLKSEIANGNDLRLFYNLMQFDSEIFNKFNFSVELSADIIRCLLRDMRMYRSGGNSTNYKSCLRAFLYFLRIRENDRYFLRPLEMYKNQKVVSTTQAQKLSTLFEAANNEFSEKIAFESDDVRMLRLVTQKFLNGRGTIDDIVNVAEG